MNGLVGLILNTHRLDSLLRDLVDWATISWLLQAPCGVLAFRGHRRNVFARWSWGLFTSRQCIEVVCRCLLSVVTFNSANCCRILLLWSRSCIVCPLSCTFWIWRESLALLSGHLCTSPNYAYKIRARAYRGIPVSYGLSQGLCLRRLRLLWEVVAELPTLGPIFSVLGLVSLSFLKLHCLLLLRLILFHDRHDIQ